MVHRAEHKAAWLICKCTRFVSLYPSQNYRCLCQANVSKISAMVHRSVSRAKVLSRNAKQNQSAREEGK